MDPSINATPFMEPSLSRGTELLIIMNTAEKLIDRAAWIRKVSITSKASLLQQNRIMLVGVMVLRSHVQGPDHLP